MLELGHDIRVQIVPLIVQNRLLQTSLHFALQENVQLCLQLGLVVGCKWASTRLFFNHFRAESENGLLEFVAQLQVLGQLGKIRQEFFATGLGQFLLYADLLDDCGLAFEQGRG